MTVEKRLDKMTVYVTAVYKMTVDKMTVDETTCYLSISPSNVKISPIFKIFIYISNQHQRH